LSEPVLDTCGTCGDGPPRPVSGTRYEQAMLVVLALTLAGSCWLLSASPGTEEGHIPWRSQSILRVITTLMALSFEYPTRRGTEIKWLVAGLGAAAALVVAGLAWYRTAREDRSELTAPTPSLGPGMRCTSGAATVAQIAMILFAGWSLASALWARWPEAAVGEGVRQWIFVLWALALGRSLSARSARQACRVVIVVLTLTAAVGVWYFIERNPYQRLKFPIGNPIFLAACLVPAITLGLGQLAARIRSDQPAASWSGSRWVGLAASLAALLVLLVAFRRADSRGPQLGLFVGVATGAFVLADRRIRRWMLVAGGLGVITAAAYFCWAGLPWFLVRRIDTVWLRWYAWSYALRLFVGQPIVGLGQGGYVLAAQQMACADAPQHPTVFVGDMLGHAHNEWLEILADLGLVGFALMAIALAATLLCAARHIRHARGMETLGLGFGLLAGLVGLIVSESTDVGLRMPGLPLVFYTVVGLIWAQSRENAETLPPETIAQEGKFKRVGGLAAVIVVSGVIAAWSIGDFQGALAERQARKLADDQQWEAALDQAAGAQHVRLAIEGYLAAAYQYNVIAFEAAADRFARMSRMLARVSDRGSLPPNIRALALEDAAAFETYGARCLSSGVQLLTRVPAYPMVAGRLAEMFLMKHRLEALHKQLGLIEEAHSYLEAAYGWMRTEYERDPYNPWVALRLFQLSTNRSMLERVDLLRIPLRAGPRPEPGRADAFRVGGTRLMLDLFGRFEEALASLLNEAEFQPTLDALLSEAEAAAALPDAVTWPDPYVPETLRLAARHRKLNRRFAEAARLAGLAADASEQIVDRFPTAVSNALIDQCRYLLLGDPDTPERAVAACQEAIRRWPASGDRLRGLRLRQSLAFYLLAAGKEQTARQELRNLAERLAQTLTNEQLDRIIGYGLGEVCSEIAGALSPEQRPSWYVERLARSLELVPDWPETRMLASFEAFRAGRSSEGVAHLAAMEKTLNDPRAFARALRMVCQAFPNDATLARFAASRLPASATQNAAALAPFTPVTGQPTTVTATSPAFPSASRP